MANYIDYHLHSNISDGTDSILELLENIKKAGIQSFSVTDHDTIDGALQMEALVPDDIHYIRGVEFSCTTLHEKCHILGYDFDPEDSLLKEALQMEEDLRRDKTKRRIEYFTTEFDIELTEEETAWLAATKSPGKPHFGRLFVTRGMAPDVKTAIETYVKQCEDGNDRIDAGVAIKAILHAGGVPIWAHPLGGEVERRLSKGEFLEQLNTLIADGIQGMECYYSRYTPEDVAFLVEQAKKHNLLISAGSDYHGSNKNNLHIAQLSVDDMAVDKEEITLYNYLSK